MVERLLVDEKMEGDMVCLGGGLYIPSYHGPVCKGCFGTAGVHGKAKQDRHAWIFQSKYDFFCCVSGASSGYQAYQRQSSWRYTWRPSSQRVPNGGRILQNASSQHTFHIHIDFSRRERVCVPTLFVSQIRKMLFILGEDRLLRPQLAISYTSRPRLSLFFYLQVIHISS